MERKNKIDIKKGIIGLFDILGYSRFLEKNSAEKAAKIIVDNILTIDTNVINQYRGLFLHMPEEDLIKTILKKIEWLIFSDTILLTLPYEDTDKKDIKDICWSLFCGVTGRLFAHLFLTGLPIRGAITYGEFFVSQNCFAGKEIVEAYQLEQQLDLSAVIFSEKSIKELQKIDAFGADGLTKNQVFEYCMPLKTESKDCFALRVPVRPLELNPATDLRQKILESFWGYRKDVDKKVYSKIDNTERYFRRVIMIAKEKSKT